MSFCNCNSRFDCTVVAVVTAAVVGVVTAFLQILGMITVTPAFLWVALGIAVVYLPALLVAAEVEGRRVCLCRALNALLAGVLGTALLALILLAVGIVATSVLSAIGVGVLLFFLWLTLASTACLVRCTRDCD